MRLLRASEHRAGAKATVALQCRRSCTRVVARGSSNNGATAATVDLEPSLTVREADRPQPTVSVDDGDAASSFRFLPSQLKVFSGLAASMRNCSWAYAALAVGNVFVNALEAVEHAHAHHHEAASEHAAAAVTAAAGAVSTAAAAAAEHVAPGAGGPSAMLLLEEMFRSVSLSDVAFCVNAIIPAALIAYSAGPFAEVAKGPDEPQMALALKGVGRLSLTLQQLAWTSGSVGVVVLLEAADKYPPMLGVASGTCLALAVARGAALWWVLSRHSSSGEEVARTLAALRGQGQGQGQAAMGPLDRAASWLALGALLQAEPGIHDRHQQHGHDHHGHGHGHQAHEHSNGNGNAASSVTAGAAAASLPPPRPHYSFGSEEERVLRSLVEAANAAGLALSLQVLATLALGVAEAATSDTPGMVSSVILATQKAANAALLFASSSAFDRALHNDDGLDDTDHLLEGLGVEHAGVSGLFTSMTVLSWALLMAGGVALLVPAMEESPLGVLVGEGVLHASADLLVEVLEAL